MDVGDWKEGPMRDFLRGDEILEAFEVEMGEKEGFERWVRANEVGESVMRGVYSWLRNGVPPLNNFLDVKNLDSAPTTEEKGYYDAKMAEIMANLKGDGIKTLFRRNKIVDKEKLEFGDEGEETSDDGGFVVVLEAVEPIREAAKAKDDDDLRAWASVYHEGRTDLGLETMASLAKRDPTGIGYLNMYVIETLRGEYKETQRVGSGARRQDEVEAGELYPAALLFYRVYRDAVVGFLKK